MELLVPLLTPADLTGLDGFVGRLRSAAETTLPAGWTVTVAYAEGLPVRLLPGVRSVTVPAWTTFAGRRRALDTVATGADAIVVTPSTEDLAVLLRQGAGYAPATAFAPVLTEQRAVSIGSRQLGRRTALSVLGLGLLAACGASTATRLAASGTTSSAAPAAAATSASAAAATSTSAAAATSAATSCVLATELTQGPYYLTVNEVRSDIREDRTGAPLVLTLDVVDKACKPVVGASVDIWHADGNGLYSGFVSQSQGAGGGSASSSDDGTFLRGTQVSDASGRVAFTTVVPGWYRGRTVHVHVLVHVSGKTVHTGQLFFDDTVLDTLFASTAPYSSRGARDTRNSNDGIYAQGGSGSVLKLVGDAAGFTSTLTMGLTV